MQIQQLASLRKYDPNRFVHAPVYQSKRTKVLLLCLGSHQEVPPHRHPGFEITLQPLKGKAELPLPDGSRVLLEPGQIITVDNGDFPFNPVNPFDEGFEMLIHLISTKS